MSFGCLPCQCKFLTDTLAAAEEVIISELDMDIDEQAEARLRRLETEERRVRRAEEQQVHEARRRRAEAEALWRAEEEARNHAENLRRRVKEAERAFKDEKSRFEQLKSDRERAELAEGAMRTEAKRLSTEGERKAEVLTFLQEHGFNGVDKAKRKMLKKNYPIHVAAEKGDERMVQMLLKEGADPQQRNSNGRTAIQVAVDRDTNNSHAGVVRVLQRASSQVSFDASMVEHASILSGPSPAIGSALRSGSGGHGSSRKVSLDDRSDGDMSDHSAHSRRSSHSRSSRRGAEAKKGAAHGGQPRPVRVGLGGA